MKRNLAKIGYILNNLLNNSAYPEKTHNNIFLPGAATGGIEENTYIGEFLFN